jgi:hypothetical protein
MTYCRPDACVNPDRHDHFGEDGEPMLCAHCGLPTHYDSGSEWYHHDDPDEGPCFLTTQCVCPQPTADDEPSDRALFDTGTFFVNAPRRWRA